MYDMIMGIVPRDCGEILTHAAVDAGAHGGTISRGKGTSANTFLQILGIADSNKDIVYVLVPSENTKKIMNAMEESSSEKKQPFGILFSTKVSQFVKSGKATGKDENMTETTHQLITIIVNKGYAEDAMAAARNAGATGGTILSARGTARPGDDTFFGVEIVPEKDMLLVLVENAKANQIIDAVKELECLSKPGSGIVFSNPAENFTLLGKKN